jgi:hypothetical protein
MEAKKRLGTGKAEDDGTIRPRLGCTRSNDWVRGMGGHGCSGDHWQVVRDGGLG